MHLCIKKSNWFKKNDPLFSLKPHKRSMKCLLSCLNSDTFLRSFVRKEFDLPENSHQQKSRKSINAELQSIDIQNHPS